MQPGDSPASPVPKWLMGYIHSKIYHTSTAPHVVIILSNAEWWSHHFEEWNSIKKHVNSNNPKVLTLIRTYKHCVRRTLSAPNVYFDIHIANPLDISAMWNTHHKIKNYFLVWVQMDVSNIGSIAQNASIHLGDGWVMKKWNNNQWNYISYICSVTRSHNV